METETNTNTTEEWRQIPSFPNYEASSLGRIRRVAPSKFRRPIGDVLAIHLSEKGYPQTGFWRKGRSVTKKVHRLVAEAFLGPPPDGMHVNHRDGNKSNNCISNLEYVTPAENNRHARQIGLWQPVRGTQHTNAKLCESDVLAIVALSGKTEQKEIARRFCVAPQTVNGILRGYAWTWLTGRGGGEAKSNNTKLLDSLSGLGVSKV